MAFLWKPEKVTDAPWRAAQKEGNEHVVRESAQVSLQCHFMSSSTFIFCVPAAGILIEPYESTKLVPSWVYAVLQCYSFCKVIDSCFLFSFHHTFETCSSCTRHLLWAACAAEWTAWRTLTFGHLPFRVGNCFRVFDTEPELYLLSAASGLKQNFAFYNVRCRHHRGNVQSSV